MCRIWWAPKNSSRWDLIRRLKVKSTQTRRLNFFPTSCFGDSIRPSSGRRHKYIKGKVCQDHTVMCPPPPQKVCVLMDRFSVTQQIFANIFCIEFYSGRRQNLENVSNFVFIYALSDILASSAPILINLILTQRNYVKIFCTQFTEIRQELWKAQVAFHWLLSVVHNWHWGAFHETLARLISFWYRTGALNFMNIAPTYLSLIQSDGQTDLVSI